MTPPRSPHPPTLSPAVAGEGEKTLNVEASLPDFERGTWGEDILLIQMHGDPGSGKSTLAKAIGRALPAIVIDKDAIKTALMRSGVEDAVVGGAAHEVARELAADFLEAGHSVVMDSPCGWPIIEERGRALAARLGVQWLMIEVTCPYDVIDERLASRTARLSQPTARQEWNARPGTYRPSCERLVLDGTRPIEELVEEALVYLRADRPHPKPVSRDTTEGPDQNMPSPALLPQRERGSGGEGAYSVLGTRNSGLAS